VKEFGTYNMNGTNLMIPPKGEGWFSIDSLDLTGAVGAVMTMGYQGGIDAGYQFELRLDSPEGKKLGEGKLGPLPKSKQPVSMVTIPFRFDAITDGKPHSIYIISKGLSDKESGNAGIFSLKLLDK
jgi:hypothetical protein